MPADVGRLFGVRVLVCGAANGIGEAIARTCARHEAEVIATDGPETDVGSRYSNVPRVTGLGMKPGGDNADAVIDVANERLDGLDVVIVCTGLQPRTPIADAAAQDRASRERLEDIRRLFEAAVPRLAKSPGGRFIAVGMLRSAFARDAQAQFDASEQALAALVRELAAGSGQSGITVNYVQPGAIMTPESRRVFGADKSLRDYCIRQSAARRLGEALDVAKVVAFIASDDATFVSGTGISVDGGRAA